MRRIVEPRPSAGRLDPRLDRAAHDAAIDRVGPGFRLRLLQFFVPRTTPFFVWYYRRTGSDARRVTEALPVLLLTTIGRRSGRPRTVALFHLPDGESFIVAGGNCARRALPAWVHNLHSEPTAEIEIGRERVRVTAEFLEGIEWDQHWRRLVAAKPDFEEAPRIAGRHIPLVRLRPAWR